MPAEPMTVELVVNERHHDVQVAPHHSLLDVLRDALYDSEQGAHVLLVTDVDGRQRGDVALGHDHDVDLPEGPRVVVRQHELVLVDHLEGDGSRDRHVAVEVVSDVRRTCLVRALAAAKSLSARSTCSGVAPSSTRNCDSYM